MLMPVDYSISHYEIVEKRSRVKAKLGRVDVTNERRSAGKEKKRERERKRRTFSSFIWWKRWRANVAVLCIFCFGSANATAIVPPTLMVRRASVQHNKWISSSNSGFIVIVMTTSVVRRKRRLAITVVCTTLSHPLSRAGSEFAYGIAWLFGDRFFHITTSWRSSVIRLARADDGAHDICDVCESADNGNNHDRSMPSGRNERIRREKRVVDPQCTCWKRKTALRQIIVTRCG